MFNRRINASIFAVVVLFYVGDCNRLSAGDLLDEENGK
jgi:hypothetical protein